LPIILKRLRDDAVVGFAEAEEQRLVHSLAIERQICGLPDANVVPGRFRVPLLGKVDPVRRLQHHRFDAQSFGLLHFLGKLAADRIGDVDLAELQRRQPGCFVGDHPKH